MKQTFPKTERLCSQKTIGRLFEKGSTEVKTSYLFPFKVFYLFDSEAPSNPLPKFYFRFRNAISRRPLTETSFAVAAVKHIEKTSIYSFPLLSSVRQATLLLYSLPKKKSTTKSSNVVCKSLLFVLFKTQHLRLKTLNLTSIQLS